MAVTVVCVPVTADGGLGPRWGRADRVAVATVEDGAVTDWAEHEVRWDALHDEGTEGSHHARVARFLRDHDVAVVAAHHMGGGMERMLDSMGIRVRTGTAGAPREIAVAAADGRA